MPETAQIIDLGQRVSVTETKVDSHEKHLDRVDASLEKLTEVSISLKEIVKHQDHNLRSTKAALANVDAQFARRDIEINSMLEHVRGEVDLKIAKIEKELIDEVTKVSTAVSDMKNTLSQSTSFFEKWKWVIIGGGGVLFFIFDKLPIIEIFVKMVAGNYGLHQ